MINYEIDPSLLKKYVPTGTTLDNWNGKTLVSVVGFLFLNARLKGIPIPFHSDFEEVNLRFYVKRETRKAIRRGVVFIKEIVPKWALARVARCTGSKMAPGPSRDVGREFWAFARNQYHRVY